MKRGGSYKHDKADLENIVTCLDIYTQFLDNYGVFYKYIQVVQTHLTFQSILHEREKY